MRLHYAFVLLAFATFATAGCSSAPDAQGDPGPVNPSVEEPLTMPKCGTVLGSFDGTSAYSNANNTGTGWSCAGGGAYGLQYQCVELVQRHFKTHWGLQWYGNAKDLLSGAPKASVDVFYNGDGAHPPVPGDMIVWTNGTYGHVALVTKVGANGVEILEQNVVGSGKATLPYSNGTIGARWGTWVPKGWAHAKANGAQNPNPPPPSQVNWSCASSSYQGKQIWTCSGSARYRCENGAPVKESCPNGCKVNPLGADDVCSSPNPPPPVNWSCASSSYQGKQIWTCSGSARYRCENGTPVKESCSNGCKVNPLGTDDVCL